MPNMIWRFITFDDQKTKGHHVPASLQRALLADLAARNHDVKVTIKLSDSAGFDQPGMINVGRPWEELRLSGLPVHFPSEDVRYFIDRLERLSVRTFEPFGRGKVHRPYFKLHDYMRCMVMKPAHYDSLLAQLKAVEVEAFKKAELFYADKKQPAEVLREVAAKSSRLPIEKIPDLGGRHNPFIPKHRGSA